MAPDPDPDDGTIDGQPDLPVIQARSDVDGDDLRGGRGSAHVVAQLAPTPVPITVAEPYVATVTATSTVADTPSSQAVPADTAASADYDQTGHDAQVAAEAQAVQDQEKQDQEKHDQEQAAADHDSAQVLDNHDVLAAADNSADISPHDDPVSGHDSPTDQSTETS